MQNYYDVLGIRIDATEEEIKEKVFAEINKWRKRVNAPNPKKQREAEEKLELIQEAENTLLDPEKRNAYDQELMGNAPTPPNEQFEQLVDSNVDNYIEELESRFHFYFNEGNNLEANLVCQELKELKPNDANVWNQLAFTNYMLGNYAEARFEINRAISLDENNPHNHFTAYQIYHGSTDLNDHDRLFQARTYVDNALALKPDDAFYNYISAQLFYEMGEYQLAIDILERFKDNPDFEFEGDLLADAYMMKVENELTTRVNYPDGSFQHLFTSREMIDQAKDILQRILNVAKNPDTRRSINEMQRVADESLKPQYNKKFMILLIIGGLWFLIALDVFSITQLVISGALTYFSWKKFRVPKYIQNKKYVDSLTKK